jgi:multiple sugar transport system ATP-binding protein
MDVYNYPNNQFVAGFIGSPAMNFFPGRLVAENSAYWVDMKDFRVKIPDHKASQYRSYVNKEVTFGLRPEDIYLRLQEERLSQEVDAMIEVVEPLGSEIIVELTAGKHTFVARVEPQTQAKAHNKVKAYFNMEKFHLFDAETERNIVQH